ncbi:hypothetical protein KKF84_01415, partial [Myxococcota bacterium]|nr:hypothetical protein [Myxococcota bacterium]
MKKSVIITVTILALAFVGGLSTGCKKKACEGGKKAGALQASAQKELGVEPSVSVSINLKSMRKSKLYSTFKDRIAKKNLGDSACGKEMMDTADSLAVVAHSPNGFKGDGKDDIMVAVLRGMDADKAMACIKKSPELKISQEKVNGKTFDAFESDSKKMYLFKADATAIVIASEAAVKKLVPGKGTLGRGD